MKKADIDGAPHPHESAPWPYRDLDKQRLAASGWRPTPIREFVLKVHQLCNLACDYCYVYTLADQSWRTRPSIMAPAVWQAAADRIAAHAAQHKLSDIAVILHGGEPLMAGSTLLETVTRTIRAAAPPSTRVDVSIQTNGVLLTESVLTVLQGVDVRIGVSVDGGLLDHDRHRRHADGRSSFAEVSAALALLGSPRYRRSFAGILTTIDPDTDPLSCYESLLEHAPPAMDFLLPHTNWSQREQPADRAFGSWLVRLFDRWYDAPVRETRIRLFEEIIHLLLGGRGASDQVGLSPAAVAIIESDGAVEQADSLKSAYPSAAETGLSILRHTFDDLLLHPGVVARQLGAAGLCATCARCPLHQVCGGGHYAHRYRPDSGFLNPSVYCDDLQMIITHIRDRVRADLHAQRSGVGTW